MAKKNKKNMNKKNNNNSKNKLKQNGFLKNTLKSIRLASTEVLKELNPTITSTVNENKEFVREKYEKIKNNVTHDKIKKFKNETKDTIKNLLSDLKQGKFYSEERVKAADAEQMKAFGFDMDDMSELDDIDIDGDDGDSFSSGDFSLDDDDDSGDTNFNQSNAFFMGGNDNEGLTNAIIDTSVATISTNSAGMSEVSSILTSILDFHNNNTARFYTEMSEKISTIGESIGKLSKVVAGTSEGMVELVSKQAESLSNLIGGSIFNLSEMTENIKASSDGFMKDMIIGQIKAISKNPLGTLTTTLIKKLIPESIKKGFETFNDRLLDLPKMLSSLAMKGSKKGGILGTISDFVLRAMGIDDIFNAKLKNKTNVSFGVKNKNEATHFDKETKTTINRVIPALLSKILASVSNDKFYKGEIIYDYDNGAFLTTEDTRKNIDNKARNKRLEGQAVSNTIGDITKLFESRTGKEITESFANALEEAVDQTILNQSLNPLLKQKEFEKFFSETERQNEETRKLIETMHRTIIQYNKFAPNKANLDMMLLEGKEANNRYWDSLGEDNSIAIAHANDRNNRTGELNKKKVTAFSLRSKEEITGEGKINQLFNKGYRKASYFLTKGTKNKTKEEKEQEDYEKKIKLAEKLGKTKDIKELKENRNKRKKILSEDERILKINQSRYEDENTSIGDSSSSNTDNSTITFSKKGKINIDTSSIVKKLDINNDILEKIYNKISNTTKQNKNNKSSKKSFNNKNKEENIESNIVSEIDNNSDNSNNNLDNNKNQSNAQGNNKSILDKITDFFGGLLNNKGSTGGLFSGKLYKKFLNFHNRRKEKRKNKKIRKELKKRRAERANQSTANSEATINNEQSNISNIVEDNIENSSEEITQPTANSEATINNNQNQSSNSDSILNKAKDGFKNLVGTITNKINNQSNVNSEASINNNNDNYYNDNITVLLSISNKLDTLYAINISILELRNDILSAMFGITPSEGINANYNKIIDSTTGNKKLRLHREYKVLASYFSNTSNIKKSQVDSKKVTVKNIEKNNANTSEIVNKKFDDDKADQEDLAAKGEAISEAQKENSEKFSERMTEDLKNLGNGSFLQKLPLIGRLFQGNTKNSFRNFGEKFIPDLGDKIKAVKDIGIEKIKDLGGKIQEGTSLGSGRLSELAQNLTDNAGNSKVKKIAGKVLGAGGKVFGKTGDKIKSLTDKLGIAKKNKNATIDLSVVPTGVTPVWIVGQGNQPLTKGYVAGESKEEKKKRQEEIKNGIKTKFNKFASKAETFKNESLEKFNKFRNRNKPQFTPEELKEKQERYDLFNQPEESQVIHSRNEFKRNPENISSAEISNKQGNGSESSIESKGPDLNKIKEDGENARQEKLSQATDAQIKEESIFQKLWRKIKQKKDELFRKKEEKKQAAHNEAERKKDSASNLKSRLNEAKTRANTAKTNAKRDISEKFKSTKLRTMIETGQSKASAAFSAVTSKLGDIIGLVGKGIKGAISVLSGIPFIGPALAIGAGVLGVGAIIAMAAKAASSSSSAQVSSDGIIKTPSGDIGGMPKIEGGSSAEKEKKKEDKKNENRKKEEKKNEEQEKKDKRLTLLEKLKQKKDDKISHIGKYGKESSKKNESGSSINKKSSDGNLKSSNSEQSTANTGNKLGGMLLFILKLLQMSPFGMLFNLGDKFKKFMNSDVSKEMEKNPKKFAKKMFTLTPAGAMYEMERNGYSTSDAEKNSTQGKLSKVLDALYCLLVHQNGSITIGGGSISVNGGSGSISVSNNSGSDSSTGGTSGNDNTATSGNNNANKNTNNNGTKISKATAKKVTNKIDKGSAEGSFLAEPDFSGGIEQLVPGKIYKSAPFGEYDPDYRHNPHTGIDIGGYGEDINGKEIHAVADGTVIASGNSGGDYGNRVIIQHSNGMQSLYAHASKTIAKEGATVKKGDVIAYVGGSGSYGQDTYDPHLHFGIYKNGDSGYFWHGFDGTNINSDDQSCVDPMMYIGGDDYADSPNNGTTNASTATPSGNSGSTGSSGSSGSSSSSSSSSSSGGSGSSNKHNHSKGSSACPICGKEENDPFADAHNKLTDDEKSDIVDDELKRQNEVFKKVFGYDPDEGYDNDNSGSTATPSSSNNLGNGGSGSGIGSLGEITNGTSGISSIVSGEGFKLYTNNLVKNIINKNGTLKIILESPSTADKNHYDFEKYSTLKDILDYLKKLGENSDSIVDYLKQILELIKNRPSNIGGSDNDEYTETKEKFNLDTSGLELIFRGH